jgi:hypothetical protein
MQRARATVSHIKYKTESEIKTDLIVLEQATARFRARARSRARAKESSR